MLHCARLKDQPLTFVPKSTRSPPPKLFHQFCRCVFELRQPGCIRNIRLNGLSGDAGLFEHLMISIITPEDFFIGEHHCHLTRCFSAHWSQEGAGDSVEQQPPHPFPFFYVCCMLCILNIPNSLSSVLNRLHVS